MICAYPPCSQEFEPKRPEQEYCSPRCQKRAKGMRQYERLRDLRRENGPQKPRLERITDELRQQVIGLRTQKLAYIAIAKQLNVSQSTVCRIVKAAGMGGQVARRNLQGRYSGYHQRGAMLRSTRYAPYLKATLEQIT